jgi:hypothetical protein
MFWFQILLINIGLKFNFLKICLKTGDQSYLRSQWMTDLKSEVSTITNKDLLTEHQHMFNLIKDLRKRRERRTAFFTSFPTYITEYIVGMF